jgi:uncharacterized SAM-binding protein YcdF (DUF218 family)
MGEFVRPMALLHLATALGLLRLWWVRKPGRRQLLWVAVPFLLLTVLSTPPAGYLALGTLEWPYPPSAAVPADAGAIVVLAGDVHVADAVRPRPELGSHTLSRCLHALALHRTAEDRPVLVSGGRPYAGAPTSAEVMRDFLVSHGVKASRLVEEGQSQNTYENAVESCRLLRERGIRRIVLVTDAHHMPRAAACFRRQGMDVVPAPCNHSATSFDHLVITDFVPQIRSATQFDLAWHEWIGYAVYWLRGRV